MNYTEDHIVEAYTGLFAGLNTSSKTRLMDSLAKSLGEEDDAVGSSFYAAFGAFGSELSAADIVADIKANRNFKDKNIAL